MSSSIPSRSSPEPDTLKLFSQKIEELPNDKALSILKSVLYANPLGIPLEADLARRVEELKQMLVTKPAELSEARTKMTSLVENKIQSLTAKQLCREILTQIPPHRISFFVDTVEGFYHQALLEGENHQEALIFALSKGILGSMVKLPSSDEIKGDEELKVQIEAIGSELGDLYLCAILRTFVGLDAVYLEINDTGNPRERYHEEAIREWIKKNPMDPIDRKARKLADIKPDLKVREFVESRLFAFLYPELTSKPVKVPFSVKALQSKASLLALAAAYPVIKKKYQETLAKINDPHRAVAEVEAAARETIGLFARLVEGMNWEGEEVVAPCFPFIEEFIRQTVQNPSADKLQDMQVSLISKLGTFITFFHNMQFSQPQLSLSLQEKALKIAAEAISNKQASLEEVMSLFNKYVNCITEEDKIRAAFPDCIIGKADWDMHLGMVEDVPLPPGMLDILNQPCPVTGDERKVGETHRLVLIPKTVNGERLTLNSLGFLVTSKGHFPLSNCGYNRSSLDISQDPSFLLTEEAKSPVDNAHWVLMTRDVLPASRGKGYEEQKTMVAALAIRSRSPYMLPRVLDATAYIFMHYLISPEDKRLSLLSEDPPAFTLCREFPQSWPVSVGGLTLAGLRVYNRHYYSYISRFSVSTFTVGAAAVIEFYP